MSRGGISFGDRKINCLQALTWWVTDLVERSKIIYLNHFKTDILYEVIEELQLDFEDTRDVKGGVSRPKTFSHKKLTQWEDIIYK